MSLILRRINWTFAFLSLGLGLSNATKEAHGAEEISRAVETRNIATGQAIPDQGYCDQPYVLVLPSGDWLCTMTTGPGKEGDLGQHVVSTNSSDQGKTWSPLVDIEPSDGPEASWVVPLLAPSGRIYAFYDYNGDDIHTLGDREIRADTIGWYCYRYSDDQGRSWSSKRYRLPMRVTACDRTNNWQGDVQIFWGICKPITVGDTALFSFTKLGKYMLDQGEGWLYRSSNVLSELDPAKIQWELLPDGEDGIRADPFGSVQEEHNLVALSDGSLYCVYRTTTGYPCHTYSRDGGRTWQPPTSMTYTPEGRMIKNPRACPRVWRTKQGKFLFWFHNHNGKSYTGRNPVWITGGVETNGQLHWAQPEILLYDDNPSVGMSYPDLIEEDGSFWVSETQKSIARVHRVETQLLNGLWNQGRSVQVAQQGLLADLAFKTKSPFQTDLPTLNVATGGITVELWLQWHDLAPNQILLDNRDKEGRGLVVTTIGEQQVQIEMNDGTHRAQWSTDPHLLTVGKTHHIVFIVDAGPRIISTLVDGILCDGGTTRQYGWGRFEGDLGDVAGSGLLQVAPRFHGIVQRLRVYGRYLTTSQAVAHFHAGP